MKFKLILVMTDDEKTEQVIEIAREHGATGATVITSARGEGLEPKESFLGLTVVGQRDVILLLVEEHMSRTILETIGRDCSFEMTPGAGVAIQIDIEDAIGLRGQIEAIKNDMNEKEL